MMKRVLISGGSGFVGNRLAAFLGARGYAVKILSRTSGAADTIQWDPANEVIPQSALNDADVVINLAGANIADKRWTASRKKILRESRISSTRTLVNAMLKDQDPPSLFISTSGVNFYPAGDKQNSEADPAGDTFLSGLCQEWEAEAFRAEQSGIRIAVMRLGVVLDRSGGALEKMLPAYRLGMGGPIGSGKQFFPWISMVELMHIILFIIENPSVQGPLNVVHPECVTQREFAAQLAKVLNRPAVMKLPAIMVRTLFGQMGEETLLASINVTPEKLLLSGYAFSEKTLTDSLSKMFSG